LSQIKHQPGARRPGEPRAGPLLRLAKAACRNRAAGRGTHLCARAGELVPAALAATRKGGTVVCAGIHMSAIPSFDYRLLWGERVLKSVANLTRADGEAFFVLLENLALQTHVQTFALRDAHAAVQALRAGAVNGAAVIIP